LTTLSDAELLAHLVAFDSTSRNSNLPIADFLCNYLDRPGVRLVRNPAADGSKVNLVFIVGPDRDRGPERRPGLVLSGHMDVVPAEEPEWESDPFTLAERDDRWVGRGTCDMKGFLALAANLAAERAAGAAAAPHEGGLAHPLGLLFTYDEEVGTLGARRLVESCPEARALPASAVIGEPTGLRVARAHKGHLTLRVTLHGRSAHSGYPHLGRNAIEPAGAVIGGLARLRCELAAERVPHAELFPEVPFVPLNLGRVQGGTAINVVPDRCTVELGLRALPGVDSRQLIERVERTVRKAAAPFTPEVEVLTDSPPLLAAEDAPLVRALAALAGQRETGAVSFATDAGWLQGLGMDCVLFGPGSIEAAHRPNEHLPKADLRAARAVLERAIEQFCVAAR
jgi:acetylornithine deacetylase